MAARRRAPRSGPLRQGQLGRAAPKVIETLRHATVALEGAGASFCLVGGFAVSVRGEPRTTRDIDFALSTADDTEAEGVILALQRGGFVVRELFERDDRTIATVRLSLGASSVRTDLLVGTSSIEREVVNGSQAAEVVPGLVTRVASRPHLLAMKVLAGRPKDLADIETLIQHATATEVRKVEPLLRLISERLEQPDLVARWRKLLKARPRSGALKRASWSERMAR